MKTARVVCRPVLAPGFALAGIVADAVPAGEPAEPVVRELAARDDVGALLIQDAIYQGLAPDLRARVERNPSPVVVPFPDPFWEAPPSAEARVVALLRRAIGYRVKLR